jgi:hypothetical protein
MHLPGLCVRVKSHLREPAEAVEFLQTMQHARISISSAIPDCSAI